MTTSENEHALYKRASSGRPCRRRIGKVIGIGIPSDALPHIFERFYWVDKSRSGNFDSAGLGLSIGKSIGIAPGAQVKVESQVGGGCRFHVDLPLSKN